MSWINKGSDRCKLSPFADRRIKQCLRYFSITVMRHHDHRKQSRPGWVQSWVNVYFDRDMACWGLKAKWSMGQLGKAITHMGQTGAGSGGDKALLGDLSMDISEHWLVRADTSCLGFLLLDCTAWNCLSTEVSYQDQSTFSYAVNNKHDEIPDCSIALEESTPSQLYCLWICPSVLFFF